MEPARDRGHAALVGIVDGDEDRSVGRQHVVRRQLRLAERAAKRIGDAHHFTRRPHLGPEYRIELTEFVERKNRLLHRDVGGRDLLGKSNGVQRFTQHYARGDGGERHADRLRHEWDRSTAARIYFQHVNLPVLDRVLDVDQPDDIERFRQRHGMLAHLLDVVFVDQVRRKHAGRIAGVDSRVLDVLHHPADDDALSIRDRIYVRLEGILQKAIDQYGFVLRDAGGTLEIVGQRVFVVNDFHGASAKHVRRPYQHRIPNALGRLDRLFQARHRTVLRLPDPERPGNRVEPPTILGDVDRIGLGAQDADSSRRQSAGELERSLTTQLHDHAKRLFALHYVENVLEGERLEVKLVGDVEIGGDGLRVRVDHDRLVTLLAQRQCRAHAAVVELDALSDAVRTTAEDDDRLLARPGAFAFLVVATVQIWRRRWKLTGTGIDHLVSRDDSKPESPRAGGALGFAAEIGKLLVGESHSFHPPRRGLVDAVESGESSLGLE